MGSLLVRWVDLVPRRYICARVRVLPVLAIDLPAQARWWGNLVLPAVARRSRCRARCVAALNNHRKTKMARKPATRVEFTLFDVVYEDGSLRSNRRVPSDVLGGLDGDAAARAVIEEQDRIIAEKSGTPAVGVKSIHRSGSKNIDRTIRPSRRELASD